MKGSVTLVGAGCGPGLLTAAGLEAVRQAEVLVYDALLDSALLKEAAADCELIPAGKRSGAHSMQQDEISKILCEKAKEGKQVVRLKGGDSFVFGRGGEECLCLEAAGIPFSVIPGVTSAVAVPEHFGIPVTHRGTAQSFTVVTGRSGTGEAEDYGALAALKGTLVFLMGIRSLREITERLMENGKAPDTPAAVLIKGFSPEEERIDGTLGTIASLAENAPTPGILVVGETAAMHLGERSESSGSGPLSGCRTVVAGTRHFAEKTARRLRELGAEASPAVCMEIVPLKENIPKTFEGYDWLVFTSANGTGLFFETLRERGTDLRQLGKARFACIGPGTAEQLLRHGFRADLLPERYTARDLGEALAEVCGQEAERRGPGRGGTPAGRILILRAEQGSPELPEALKRAGIPYEDIKIYRTEAVETEGGTGGVDIGPGQPGSRKPDYLVFGSAGCVRAWSQFRGIPEGTVPVCIGAYTEAGLKRHFGGRSLTAGSYTADGIAEAIRADLENRRRAEDGET